MAYQFQILFLMKAFALFHFSIADCDIMKHLKRGLVFSYNEEEVKSMEDQIEDVNNFNANFTRNFNEMKAIIKSKTENIDELDISYLLFTQETKNNPSKICRSCYSPLYNTNFNSIFPTIFFIHGAIKKLDLGSSLEFVLKDFLLENGPYNVVYVNYTSLNQGNYIESSTNSFLVAKHIHLFLKHLFTNSELKSRDLHVIGLSLGAQVAGNVGFYQKGIRRITGLEPTDKIFGRMPNRYKLDSTDADFVDIIHTSAVEFPKGFGLSFSRGHFNFYPNGGKFQPGCKDMQLPKYKLKPEVIEFIEAECSHLKSFYYFLESVCSTDCQFLSVQCDSYQNFLNKNCLKTDTAVVPMGFYADNAAENSHIINFYLNTNPMYPFCKKL